MLTLVPAVAKSKCVVLHGSVSTLTCTEPVMEALQQTAGLTVFRIVFFLILRAEECFPRKLVSPEEDGLDREALETSLHIR